MTRSRMALDAFIVVAALFLIAAICYISLLGENKKIDELTQTFFQEVREGVHGEATAWARVNAPGPTVTRWDSLFLLELSLLKHYALLDTDSYDVVTRRSRLWMPFTENNRVGVSVALRKKPEGRSLADALSRMGRFWSSGTDAGLIGGLLTMTRKNGNWVVENVNVRGSILEKTYGDVGERLRSRHYLTRDPQGFTVHEFAVRPADLDPIEKRLLLHALQEARMLLGGSQQGESTKKNQGLRLR